jgi:hypothetical protein
MTRIRVSPVLTFAFVAMCVAAPLLVRPAPAQAAPSYTVFDPAGSIATYGWSINKNGDIAGTWQDASTALHGFLRMSNGTLTAFDTDGNLPNIDVRSINDHDWIAGDYSDYTTTSGFIRAPDGKITIFQAPSSNGYTVIMAINSKKAFAGTWESNSGQAHGFYVTPTGRFESFDPKGSAATSVSCMNDSGTVAGDWFDGTNYHNFVRGLGGVTSFDVPGNTFVSHVTSTNRYGVVAGYFSTTTAAKGFIRTAGGFTTFSVSSAIASYVKGITSKNLVVGEAEVNGIFHGFFRQPNGVIKVFDPKGSVGTDPLAVNDSNVITGGYTDKNNLTHGFLRTP